VRDSGEPRAQEKMKITRVSSDFSAIVKNYTDLQKQIVAKMKITYLPHPRGSVQLDNDDDQTKSLVDSEETQAQAQRLQETLEFEQGLLVEREERIRQIESDIIDVNEIMRDLGSMVAVQGDAIDSIEGNIQETYNDVEAGREELQKAVTYQTKRRKRLFCLLGTGFIVLIIVIIILVTDLKN